MGIFPSGRFNFRLNYILLIIEEVRMREKRNSATETTVSEAVLASVFKTIVKLQP